MLRQLAPNQAPYNRVPNVEKIKKWPQGNETGGEQMPIKDAGNPGPGPDPKIGAGSGPSPSS